MGNRIAEGSFTPPQEMQNKWIIFIICGAAYFFVFLHRMSTAVIVSDFRREFGATAAQLGLLSSVYFYSYAILQIPVGILADRLGSKNTMVGGLIIAVAGSLLFASSHSLSLCIVARMFTSAGMAGIYVPALNLFLAAFGPRKFPIATGLLGAVGQSGGLAASTPLALSVQALGWRGSFYVIAAATLAIAIMIFFTLKVGTRREAMAVYARHKAQEGADGAAGGVRANWWGLLILACVGMFTFGPSLSFQGLWGLPFLMDVHHLTRVGGSLIISVLPFGSIAGYLILAAFISRIKRNKGVVLSGASFVAVLCWIPLAMLTAVVPPNLLFPLSFLFGLSSGSTSVALNNITPHWLGTRNRAASLAIVNTGNMVGAALFQLGMGWLIDGAARASRPPAEQYHAAFLLGWSGALLAFGFTLVVAWMLYAKGRASKGFPVGPSGEQPLEVQGD